MPVATWAAGLRQEPTRLGQAGLRVPAAWRFLGEGRRGVASGDLLMLKLPAWIDDVGFVLGFLTSLVLSVD